jgi:hypothetical protein
MRRETWLRDIPIESGLVVAGGMPTANMEGCFNTTSAIVLLAEP